MDETERGYWIVANHKHLKEYREDVPNLSEFEATQIAGKAGLFLEQIRGHGDVPFERAVALARTVGISERMLVDTILPRLREATGGRVDFDGQGRGGPTQVEEHIDTESTLFKSAAAMHRDLHPSATDEGAILTLSHTSGLPRTYSEATQGLIDAGLSETQAKFSIENQASFELVKVFEDDGLVEPVIFNEYIWRCDPKRVAHLISGLDSGQRENLQELIDDCEYRQGAPEERFEDRDLIQVAESVGLLDAVIIKTANDTEKGFLFTPHLRSATDSSPFANDLFGDVKLFLASMGFGENYSRISRLGGSDRDKTINFMRKLLRDGEAGDATAIGVDYVMLEERGIIRVEKTSTSPGTRYKMVLLKPDVVELALAEVEAEQQASPRPMLALREAARQGQQGEAFVDSEATRMRRKDRFAKIPQMSRELRAHYMKRLRGET